MKYKYIIFDFNGTIINDVELCLNLLNKMLSKRDYQGINCNDYKNIFTFPIKEYYRLAGFDLDKYDFDMLSKEFIADYQGASMECKLYDKCQMLLEYLVDKGYKLLVLSASQIDNLKEQLKSFGIDKYFIKILGLDNIYASSKVKIAQNYFDISNINPSEVLMVGDTTHDFEVGKALNVEVILVSDGHQSYEVLEKTECKIISNISSLFEIL